MLKKFFPFALILVAFSLQAKEASSVQNTQLQLQQFLQDTSSLSARFQQKLVDQYGYLLQQSAGQLNLQRPGKFRWDYILPYPQNIISNGQKIWMYDSELEQVNVRPYDQLLTSSPVKLLDNQVKLEEAFVIEPMADAEGQQWLKLRSKDTESDFKQMEIGLLKGQIKTMRFKDNFNQMTEIEFEQLIVNPGFKSERFEFTAPEGTDIVGDF